MNAWRLADDFVLRRGRAEAESWALREYEMGGRRPYWKAVLERVRAEIPRTERHGVVKPTLWDRQTPY